MEIIFSHGLQQGSRFSETFSVFYSQVQIGIVVFFKDYLLTCSTKHQFDFHNHNETSFCGKPFKEKVLKSILNFQI
jgi:hypothetical protein